MIPKEDGATTQEARLTSQHLSYFVSFLEREYAATLNEISSLIENGEVNFDLLWAILKPNSTLYTKCELTEEPCGLRLLRADRVWLQTTGNPFWQLHVAYIDYNTNHGNITINRLIERPPKFGLALRPTPLTIAHFEGTRKIANLPIYPIQFFPQTKELISSLISRGKNWVSLQGKASYMQYRKDGSLMERDLRLLVSYELTCILQFLQFSKSYHV